MTHEEQKKLAAHIIRLLKVRSVSFPIAQTDKGNFSIKYTSDQNYEMVLDAVPLSTKNNLEDDNNIELKAVLEKYWFEKEKDNSGFDGWVKPVVQSSEVKMETIYSDNLIPEAPNKRKPGRPKKVKA